MSKSNVNPNHYKVAGRERQGEDILQQRHKEKLATSLARERFEARPAYTDPIRTVVEASAGSADSTGNQVPPTNQTARKKPAAAPSKADVAARHAAKPGAGKHAPTPPTRRAPTKAQASATTGRRSMVQKRASSRNKARLALPREAGAHRKKPSTGRRGKR